VISNPYYEHRIALATNTGKTGSNPAFEVFKSEKIAVQRTTASDYFLMTAYGGQLRQNVVHFVGFGDAADAFVKGEVAALMGTRAQIEGHLKDSIEPSGISEPATPGIVRSSWVIGTAVKSDNRDLDNAIGKALSELRLSGALPEIFGRFGVTYRPSLAP
jgi:ABC-type amino acid transport substrate-binding protein